MSGITEKLPEDWHAHEGYRAIFNAALAGILANPQFYGPAHQGEARSAVAFAQAVLLAALQATDPRP